MRNLMLVMVLLGVSACAAKSPQAGQGTPDKVVILSEKVTLLENSNLQLANDIVAIREENDMLRAELKKELEALGAKLEKPDSGDTHITLQPEILFASGSIRINRPGRKVLHKIAGALLRLPKGTRVRVAGHTDNVVPGRNLRHLFPNNLELSVARALAVARFLVKEEGLDPDLILVEGHGASSPVASNSTSAGRAKNRRISIFYPEG